MGSVSSAFVRGCTRLITSVDVRVLMRELVQNRGDTMFLL